MSQEQALDVLVVDDNDSLLELAVRALTKAGFKVRGAATYTELDSILATGPTPRLILMDVQMPELFGDDVASTLRHSRGVTAKIYLHSSLDKEYLLRLASQAGLDGAISKNSGIASLVEEVRRLLAAS